MADNMVLLGSQISELFERSLGAPGASSAQQISANRRNGTRICCRDKRSDGCRPFGPNQDHSRLAIGAIEMHTVREYEQ